LIGGLLSSDKTTRNPLDANEELLGACQGIEEAAMVS
jgi:hypothetical protein